MADYHQLEMIKTCLHNVYYHNHLNSLEILSLFCLKKEPPGGGGGVGRRGSGLNIRYSTSHTFLSKNTFIPSPLYPYFPLRSSKPPQISTNSLYPIVTYTPLYNLLSWGLFLEMGSVRERMAIKYLLC